MIHWRLFSLDLTSVNKDKTLKRIPSLQYVRSTEKTIRFRSSWKELKSLKSSYLKLKNDKNITHEKAKTRCINAIRIRPKLEELERNQCYNEKKKYRGIFKFDRLP